MKVNWSDIQEAAHGSMQTLAAFLVISELSRMGVTHFVVSPGSRSIPLILSLNFLKNNSKDFSDSKKIIYVNDERAASFMAQGLAKTGALPCLIATSGTAVANYLPGVIEAYYSNVPMIVLVADRPWELQNANANQTINQRNIFDDYLSSKLELPALEKNLHAHSLLSNIDYLVSQALNLKKPAYLNISYRKPFYDNNFKIENDLNELDFNVLKKWSNQDCPYVKINKSKVQFSAEGIEKHDNYKPLFVAGPILDTKQIDQILNISRESNIPICADIHSNLRQKSGTTCLSLFNLYFRNFENVLRSKNDLPSVVYHLGGRMISDAVHAFLSKYDIEVVLVNDFIQRQDAIENEFIYPTRHISFFDFIREVSENKVEKGYQDFYYNLEQSIANKLSKQFLVEGMTERNIICRAISNAKEDSSVFLSASLIFREADNFVTTIPKDIKLYGNRGATGIDGIIASSVGVSLGNKKPLLCIVGDQAALHDVTSLSLLKDLDESAIILIINNSGGAIFNFMPSYGLNDILANPHNIEFSHFAEAYGLQYKSSKNIEDLESVIKEISESKQKCVIEVKTLGKDSVFKLNSI